MQYPARVGPIVNDEAPFTPSMTQGCAPERSRAWQPLRTGWNSVAPEVIPFSIEMILGSRPERARAFTAPRIPLPVSQTTHVPAAFSPEMAAGYGPPSPRLFLPLRTGWSVSQTTHTAAPFSMEMAQGSIPTTNRAWKPPQLGWTTSQTTPVPAPFSPEMVQGWVPYSARPARPKGYGYPIYTPETIVVVVNVPRPFSAQSSVSTAISVISQRATQLSVQSGVVRWLVMSATSTTPTAQSSRGNSLTATSGEI